MRSGMSAFQHHKEVRINFVMELGYDKTMWIYSLLLKVTKPKQSLSIHLINDLKLGVVNLKSVAS